VEQIDRRAPAGWSRDPASAQSGREIARSAHDQIVLGARLGDMHRDGQIFFACKSADGLVQVI
jgi:hypothetical protein